MWVAVSPQAQLEKGAGSDCDKGPQILDCPMEFDDIWKIPGPDEEFLEVRVLTGPPGPRACLHVQPGTLMQENALPCAEEPPCASA